MHALSSNRKDQGDGCCNGNLNTSNFQLMVVYNNKFLRLQNTLFNLQLIKKHLQEAGCQILKMSL